MTLSAWSAVAKMSGPSGHAVKVSRRDSKANVATWLIHLNGEVAIPYGLYLNREDHFDPPRGLCLRIMQLNPESPKPTTRNVERWLFPLPPRLLIENLKLSEPQGVRLVGVIVAALVEGMVNLDGYPDTNWWRSFALFAAVA